MLNIQWTLTAVKSYDSLISRTKSFENSLDKVLATIQEFPNSFPFYDENKRIIKAVINKQHILFYVVPSPNTAHLLLFFDTRMSVEQLKKLL